MFVCTTEPAVEGCNESEMAYSSNFATMQHHLPRAPLNEVAIETCSFNRPFDHHLSRGQGGGSCSSFSCVCLALHFIAHPCFDTRTYREEVLTSSNGRYQCIRVHCAVLLPVTSALKGHCDVTPANWKLEPGPVQCFEAYNFSLLRKRALEAYATD